jgi:hypothetical protein
MCLTSELCQTVGDELVFDLTLEVDKTQDLTNKIFQTLGDTRTYN